MYHFSKFVFATLCATSVSGLAFQKATITEDPVPIEMPADFSFIPTARETQQIQEKLVASVVSTESKIAMRNLNESDLQHMIATLSDSLLKMTNFPTHVVQSLTAAGHLGEDTLPLYLKKASVEDLLEKSAESKMNDIFEQANSHERRSGDLNTQEVNKSNEVSVILESPRQNRGEEIMNMIRWDKGGYLSHKDLTNLGIVSRKFGKYGEQDDYERFANERKKAWEREKEVIAFRSAFAEFKFATLQWEIATHPALKEERGLPHLAGTSLGPENLPREVDNLPRENRRVDNLKKMISCLDKKTLTLTVKANTFREVSSDRVFQLELGEYVWDGYGPHRWMENVSYRPGDSLKDFIQLLLSDQAPLFNASTDKETGKINALTIYATQYSDKPIFNYGLGEDPSRFYRGRDSYLIGLLRKNNRFLDAKKDFLE